MWSLRRRPKSDESKAAVKNAKNELDKIKARSTEVSREAKIQKDLREKNHFIETMTIIFGGKP